MKVIVTRVLNCAADLYKYALIPPTLETTRQIRRQRLLNKPSTTIKKKTKRRKKTLVSRPCTNKENWAISENQQKGIYMATKIAEDEEDPMEDVETAPESEKPKSAQSDSDRERILELEKQLELLKNSLATLNNSNTSVNMSQTILPTPPPPPPLKNQSQTFGQQTLNDTMTPSLTSPPVANRVPAPNFDQLETPQKLTQTVVKSKTPPIPPPPPAITRCLTETQLCRSVPSGLQRTQSITDLIVSGKASTAMLRKVDVNRSPGGTPIKVVKENFLAKALRLKFKVYIYIHYVCYFSPLIH